MNPSKHSDEWKRVIATAALAGVTFKQVWITQVHSIWLATLPTPISGSIEAPSKYEVAVKALRIMDNMGEKESASGI